jgi:uncharacterized protein
VLQLIGYLVYVRYFLKDAIRPNAVSWIMFAYGTAFIVFLEWRSGAVWNVLVLPVVCSAMSLLVAAMCIRSRLGEPTNALERGAFAADLALTVGYLGLRSTSLAGPLFNAGFIIASNLTAVTAFLPILWSTWKEPDNEKIAPWVFWSMAYGVLTISTLLSVGISAPTLLIYPILSLVIHGAMVVIIVGGARRASSPLRNEENVFVGRSLIAGQGIFASKPYLVGDPVIILEGPRIVGPGPADHGPNWVGIGKDEWIDPIFPVCYLNHTCEPNAAFSDGLLLRALRPIAQGEEITMDYSTTEVDESWVMACACGKPTCRGTLKSIQLAFANSSQPPQALPIMQTIWQQAKTTGSFAQNSV